MPRTPRLLLPGALLGAALLTGCSQGPDAFNENLPGDEADTTARLVPRLPEAPRSIDPEPVLTVTPRFPPPASQEDAGRSQ